MEFWEESIEFGIFESEEDIIGLDGAAGGMGSVGMGTMKRMLEGFGNATGKAGRDLSLRNWSEACRPIFTHSPS